MQLIYTSHAKSSKESGCDHGQRANDINIGSTCFEHPSSDALVYASTSRKSSFSASQLSLKTSSHAGSLGDVAPLLFEDAVERVLLETRGGGVIVGDGKDVEDSAERPLSRRERFSGRGVELAESHCGHPGTNTFSGRGWWSGVDDGGASTS